MSVNVFVINRDSVSRNADMNICLMIRDVRVFGCECGADAVSLAESVVPELVFFRLSGDDGDVCGVIKNIIKIYPSSVIAVAAFALNDGGSLEDQCRKAGAMSFIYDDVSKDGFLYLIKNFADIIRSRKDKTPEQNSCSPNGKFCSFITEVAGYNDILSMNRKLGALQIKPNLSKNLIYIRVFSFIYDFLVKCFLDDIKITVGTVADTRRIMIIFPWDGPVREILKNAVFYSIAEKYIHFCGDFCKIYLALDAAEFGSVIDISWFAGKKHLPGNFASGVLFEKALADMTLCTGDLSGMLKAARFYEGFMDIFTVLADFLDAYAPSIELEFNREVLSSVLKELDAAVSAVFSLSGERGGPKLYGAENTLYAAVLKLQIILNIYRQR